MTINKRIFFETSDIQAIQLECNACGTTISCPSGKWKPEASSCPNCGVALIKDVDDVFTLKKLADSLGTLLALKKKLNFQLRFEFKQQDEPEPD
jgi:hypothetical protein